ncbi:MAG: hypothetical protein HWN69_02820 [Desulfobacterales bacterium]|nr:hypothetical protein [Desulfobacterales bacterium]
MKFKNELEEQAFLIAKKVCGGSAAIDHNKTLRIESALYPEVAAFSGPPKKEIDILTAELKKDPKVDLLVSCKNFQDSRAEPAHVQEWGAVVQTMNKYVGDTTYLGLVLSPSGFTKGCEPWATSSNVALIPPLKGKQIAFPYSSSLKMFERTLAALTRRLSFPSQDLFIPPGFYDFAYRLTADFEGYQAESASGERYLLARSGWRSSFGELVATLIGKRIAKILSIAEFLCLQLEDGAVFRYYGEKIVFGYDDGIAPIQSVTPTCTKNLSFEKCSFDLIEKLATGQRLASAGDFGTHFEFGLENEINLGFFPGSVLHVLCTKNPVEDNEL